MAQPNIRSDRVALQRAMNAIISDARSKSAPRAVVSEKVSMQSSYTILPERIAELVFDVPTRRRLGDLVLPDAVRESVDEFIYEYQHAALLRAHSLEPRHTLLLVGPPGNGKTSLAEAVATELALPLLSVRYDAIVDSFLGETATRFRRLIDYASLNPSVLFFDEFDAVGKERGDSQETGEIKRVVSSLLVQLDRLPAHSIVICATNHPELLDRAVWRRFEVKIEIPIPGPAQLRAWFEKFKRSLGARVSAGITSKEFVDCMAGESMSEVEAFTLDVRRKLVLSKGALTPAQAVKEVLSRWQQRLKKQHELGEYGADQSASETTSRTRKRSANKRKETSLPQQDSLPGTE